MKKISKVQNGEGRKENEKLVTRSLKDAVHLGFPSLFAT